MDREEIAFSTSDGGPVGWVRLRWRQRHRRQERKGHSEEGCGQERRRQAGTVGICNPDRAIESPELFTKCTGLAAERGRLFLFSEAAPRPIDAVNWPTTNELNLDLPHCPLIPLLKLAVEGDVLIYRE